jgi:DHA2 family multidrug resistance protein-like MFS transporter
MAVLLSLPFRLQEHYGLSPGEVGAMIAPWPLTAMLVAPVSAAISDRVPAGLLGGIGMAIATIGVILIAQFSGVPDWFDMAWRMALCGAGFGMFLLPNARLIIGSAPAARAASAGGLIVTTRLTGQALGATLVASLLASGLGTGPAPALLAAGLTLMAGLCSVARLRPFRSPSEDEIPEL